MQKILITAIAMLISISCIYADEQIFVQKPKQELTHSRDWMSVWQHDGGFIAAKKDRSLWAFGEIKKEYLAFGQIMNKKSIYTYHLRPKRIKGKWRDISVTWNRIYAIRSDGTLWGWGRDVIGSSYLSKPTQIGSSRKWQTIETTGSSEGGECGDYTLAFQSDGSLWGWGDRDREFIEFLKQPSINKPNKIDGAWNKVSMGCYEIYATKKNGSLWRWRVYEKIKGEYMFFRGLIASIILGMGIYASGVSAGANPKAMIIFDASGSMQEQIDGVTKIVMAKDALKEVVNSWNPKVELGLTAYGHRVKSDCSDIEIIVPIGKLNKKSMIDTVLTIQPKGMTPIAKSLRQVVNSLREHNGTTTIILISDGHESCEENPCGAAKQLKAEGVNFVAHVIGFHVDSKTDKQLECIAHATGGEYFSAKNAASLTEAIGVIAKKLERAKPKPVAKKPIEKKPTIKKPKYNLEISSADKESGSRVESQHHIYKLEDTKAGNSSIISLSSNKKKAIQTILPVGKYILKSRYNNIKKETPFEIKPDEATKLHIIFAPFQIDIKCTDSNATAHHEIYAQSGKLAYKRSQPCSKPITLMMNDGNYTVETRVGTMAKNTKFSSKDSKLMIDMTIPMRKEPAKIDNQTKSKSTAEQDKVIQVTKKPIGGIKNIADLLNQLGVGLDSKEEMDIRKAGVFLEALGGVLGGTPQEQTREQKEAMIAKKRREDIENKKADKEFEEMGQGLDMFTK